MDNNDDDGADEFYDADGIHIFIFFCLNKKRGAKLLQRLKRGTFRKDK
jgi:hypothetical protein